ncbi:hypothetical protein PPERSA_05546 [Pseudocohnilembus persalinus]|uniref:Uncharacterized protein n=1 Tax=Pseudocohnilembus persalinus TaxID=266149 RepID=A0A0V0QTF5_PSEPJ|nr:hypothetical protein PPERSA_05546 [Pseudocohnilembus persalinus]|eukprot:KRX05437.1 hypothetical protein PPERSA_05546 [Pseudocohnilembus persalinus]
MLQNSNSNIDSNETKNSDKHFSLHMDNNDSSINFYNDVNNQNLEFFEEDFIYEIRLLYVQSRHSQKRLINFIQNQIRNFNNFDVELIPGTFDQYCEVKRNGTNFNFKIKSRQEINYQDIDQLFPTEFQNRASAIKCVNRFSLIQRNKIQQNQFQIQNIQLRSQNQQSIQKESQLQEKLQSQEDQIKSILSKSSQLEQSILQAQNSFFQYQEQQQQKEQQKNENIKQLVNESIQKYYDEKKENFQFKKQQKDQQQQQKEKLNEYQQEEEEEEEQKFNKNKDKKDPGQKFQYQPSIRQLIQNYSAQNIQNPFFSNEVQEDFEGNKNKFQNYMQINSEKQKLKSNEEQQNQIKKNDEQNKQINASDSEKQLFKILLKQTESEKIPQQNRNIQQIIDNFQTI